MIASLSQSVRRMLPLIVFILALPAGMSDALAANCTNANLTASVTNVAIGNYNPFTSSISTSVVYTITNTGASCNMTFTLQRATSVTTTMALASPASTLNYTVQSGATTPVSLSGSVPGSGQSVSLGTPFTSGSNANVTVTFTVPVSQIVAAGGYTDTLTPTLFDAGNGARAVFTAQSVTATVLAVCFFPTAPTATNLDFSSAISNGLPNAGSIQTDSIPNAECTAPTRIQLSGNALQPTPLGSAPSGFDNFINWTATASLGLATATLTTTSPTTVTTALSTSKNTATAGTINGTISVTNVHLIVGNHIIAGAFSSSLTIQIDPSL